MKARKNHVLEAEMADDNESGKPPVKKTKKPTGDYEVGRGKPPKSGQFKPGQSGNPAGRRRRSVRRSAHASVRVARAMLWIVDGGKQVQVTAYEALLLKLCSEALKGNRRAQEQILRDKLKFARMQSDERDAEQEGEMPVTVRDHKGRVIFDNGKKPKKKPRKTKKRIESEAQKEVFDRVLARSVQVAEQGKARQITIEEAIWRSLFADALKGDVKAAAIVMRYIDTPASQRAGGTSDIIDADGMLHVKINIGKPPGLLDDDERRLGKDPK